MMIPIHLSGLLCVMLGVCRESASVWPYICPSWLIEDEKESLDATTSSGMPAGRDAEKHQFRILLVFPRSIMPVESCLLSLISLLLSALWPQKVALPNTV
eukprot:5367354-Amphidinium_carterae.1